MNYYRSAYNRQHSAQQLRRIKYHNSQPVADSGDVRIKKIRIHLIGIRLRYASQETFFVIVQRTVQKQDHLAVFASCNVTGAEIFRNVSKAILLPAVRVDENIASAAEIPDDLTGFIFIAGIVDRYVAVFIGFLGHVAEVAEFPYESEQFHIHPQSLLQLIFTAEAKAAYLTGDIAVLFLQGKDRVRICRENTDLTFSLSCVCYEYECITFKALGFVYQNMIV